MSSKDGHPLTDEQEAAVQLIVTGEDAKIVAGAGAGKTATLVAAAHRLRPQRVRGVALVYNRRNADELKERLDGSGFKGMTFHGLAFRRVGRLFTERLDRGDRMFQDELASALGITRTLRIPLQVGAVGRVDVMTPRDQVSDVIAALRKFVNSDDEQLGAEHFDRPLGMADDDWHLLLARLLPAAHRMWDDARDPDGVLPYDQAYYLRQYLDHIREGRAADRYDVALVDECFPNGTLVATPTGARPIEELEVGDVVLAVEGHAVLSTHVTRTYRTPRWTPLVRVRFDDGTSLTCTGNHPIRIPGGWVPAALLQPGEAVRRLRDSVRLTVESQQVLLAAVPSSSSQGRHGDPNGRPGDSEPDERDAAINGTPTDRARWQRHRDDARSGVAVALSRLGLEPRACRRDEASASRRLQDRPGESGTDVRSGSGRGFARDPGRAGGGPPQGRSPSLARVDRVEVLQPGRGTGPGGDSYDGAVYTLSTEVGHYVADGVVVKNCQDQNACKFAIARLVTEQCVIIGDGNQAIYGWNGARDYMNDPATAGWGEAQLSGSFRFGPVIADVANSVLVHLSTNLRIRGLSPTVGRVGPVSDPDAVLCRSNKGVMAATLSRLLGGGRPFVVGGTAELVEFAKGALQLQEDGSTHQRDLRYFASWDQAVRASQEEALFRDLQLVLEIINDLTPRRVIAELGRVAADPGSATVTISTTHRFKGMEADKVQLGPDFDDAPTEPEEIRLLYVAVTRARAELDVSAAECFVSGRYAPGLVRARREGRISARTEPADDIDLDTYNSYDT